MNLVLAKWGPPALCTLTGLVIGRSLPGWPAMWLTAFALFFSAKWVTAFSCFGQAMLGRALAYFFFWPGMDAPRFFRQDQKVTADTQEMLAPLAKMGAGAGLLGWAMTVEGWPIASGWMTMIAFVLMLHFGAFHLLSILWRKWGIDAPPIMLQPLRATSLRDLWGVRWNGAFTTLMQRTWLRPLARSLGVRGAFLGIFLISGVIHELVITVPARGGYGLPTAYFMGQGAGALFEQTQLGNRLGLGHGWRGWLFTLGVAGAPAYFLFPPAFIQNVMFPILQTLKLIAL